MEIYELIAPCHFGLEAVMKRKLRIWDMISVRWKMERLPFGGMQKLLLMPISFCVRRREFS